MKYGLELEYFIRKNGNISAVPMDKNNIPILPYDESGYLVECRGKPQNTLLDAVYSLKADMFMVQNLVKSAGFDIDSSPVNIIPNDVSNYVRRHYTKGITTFENYYGFDKHNITHNMGTAGIHISFTDPVDIFDKATGITHTTNRIFDFIKLFKAIDKEFEHEIKYARRRPGMYELKSDGRIEYRSLPNNLNLDNMIN
jgi:hypothetical protein